MFPPRHADYYTSCNPEDLHPPTRFKRVLERLGREVDAGAVVCLQEVSISWVGPLHAFFQQRGYSFVTHLYSALTATALPLPTILGAFTVLLMCRRIGLVPH